MQEHTPLWTRPSVYAALCGVSREAIDRRHKLGQLTYTYHQREDGKSYPMVDANAYPPVAKRKAGRPRKLRAVKSVVAAYFGSHLDAEAYFEQSVQALAPKGVDLVAGDAGSSHGAYEEAVERASLRYDMSAYTTPPLSLPVDNAELYCERAGLDINGARFDEGFPSCLVVLYIQAA